MSTTNTNKGTSTSFASPLNDKQIAYFRQLNGWPEKDEKPESIEEAARRVQAEFEGLTQFKESDPKESINKN